MCQFVYFRPQTKLSKCKMTKNDIQYSVAPLASGFTPC